MNSLIKCTKEILEFSFLNYGFTETSRRWWVDQTEANSNIEKKAGRSRRWTAINPDDSTRPDTHVRVYFSMWMDENNIFEEVVLFSLLMAIRISRERVPAMQTHLQRISWPCLAPLKTPGMFLNTQKRTAILNVSAAEGGSRVKRKIWAVKLTV